MKHIILFFVFLFFPFSIVMSQQPFAPAEKRNAFSFSSPGAFRFGLYGYDTPALLTYVHQPDLFFTWWDKSGTWKNISRWGVFAAVPHVGFGMVQEHQPQGYITEYRLAGAVGNRTLSSGLSYGWTSATDASIERRSTLTLASLYRPLSVFSVGITYTQALQKTGWELGGDVAVRPFGNELLTLFAEYNRYEADRIKKDMWSTGVVTEVLQGVRFSGRYFSNNAISLGIHISLGNAGIEGQKYYSHAGKQLYNVYGIRLGASDRTFLHPLTHKKKVLPVNLHGTIGYRRYELFDRTKTLTELLNLLEAAKNDPNVTAIALNTSGMETDMAKLWELREKVKEIKATGKKVFIFLDRGTIPLYHFATVADSIIMDPYGTLNLSGFVYNRTYMKGTLEKIGLGFREMRLFKYKSANESFSRENFSDGEKEQWERILQCWYERFESDICESRKITPQSWKNIIDNDVMLLAAEAQERRLVDIIGRWDTVLAMAKQLTGDNDPFISSKSLTAYNTPYDERWSEPPQIAILYALGACDMEEGIQARKLADELQAAFDDKNIKAIVLRIDSPGGDAMASDYIARILKQNKGKKPVIVSQGYVAASGGYWLSMYADTIVTTPGTLTGSIGVIGGWFYNSGLKESLGFSTDKVAIGAHADLFSGLRLPLLNIQLPDRDMTDEEATRMFSMISSLYKQFTANVAEGRKLHQNKVDSLGQGRIWTGTDAQRNGLADVLGGLDVAITLAKERAGIPPQEHVTLIERPKLGLFNLQAFMPKLIGMETAITQDPSLKLLQFYLKRNGNVMPLLPLYDHASLLDYIPQ